MKINPRKHHTVILATSAFITFAVAAGCRHTETAKESANKYMASRRGLTSVEKKKLQAEINKVNASSLNKEEKQSEESKIFHHYSELANQPKSGR